MIVINHKGNFNKVEKFLRKPFSINLFAKYGREGVAILSSVTPIDTGKTASSWDYRVEFTKTNIKIVWTNSNIVSGVPIAIIIQYGHGTRNGGFVQGRDYINPAMRPVFDRISSDIWKEVTSS